MPAATSKRSFETANRSCDVVLKGGVTSGIVYPLALCELATAFRFRNIGGTSSGAIVAAFAAAAEYHRQTPPRVLHTAPRAEPPVPGFRGLERFAEQLERPRNLLEVFLPESETKPIFDVLLAGQLEQAEGRATGAPEAAHPARRSLLALLNALPRRLPLAGAGAALAVVAALAWPAAERIAQLVHEPGLAPRLLGDALALGVVVVLLVATALGALGGALVALHRLVTRSWAPAIVRHGFGLARGLRVAPGYAVPGAPEPEALTARLTRVIDELAGLEPYHAPLTFGDLWSVQGDGPGDRGLTFELVTTCLTLGRPFRLPEDLDRDPPLYFDPAEWREYFPARVVEHLVRTSPDRDRPRRRDPARPDDGPAYFRLPKRDDLPIVVATRLSVAFPLVITATPLWSVDMNARGDRDHATRRLERVWFSDGGASSNFPIHFFDQLLPRWPTFGIDLERAADDYPLDPCDERRNVWMPLTNDAGRAERWTRFASDADPSADPSAATPAVALRSLGQFVGALVSTMMSWRDNTLAQAPGFRDRIVHVKLDDEREGGLNLAMPVSAIIRLGERGAAAGALLRHRYTVDEEELAKENKCRAAELETASQEERRRWRPTTVSWENHRWVRYRIGMASLQLSLDRLDRAYEFGGGYRPLVERPPGKAPTDFHWTDDQRDAHPAVRTEALRAAVQGWAGNRPPMRFDEGALPQPLPELRVAPRV